MKSLRLKHFLMLLVPIALCACLVAALEQDKILKRRQQCERNMMTIWRLSESYYAIHGSFPPGTATNAVLSPNKRPSWLAQLSPFFDLGPIRLLPPDATGAQRPSFSGEVWFLRCPGELNHQPNEISGLGITNYVGIAGLGTDSPRLPTSHIRAGMFGYDRIVTLADVTDGVSFTAMIAESNAGVGPWAIGGASTVRGLDIHSRPYIGDHRQFGGTHRYGAMALFVDGSVRFLKSDIDPQVFEAYTTIGGNERKGTEDNP